MSLKMRLCYTFLLFFGLLSPKTFVKFLLTPLLLYCGELQIQKLDM